MTSVVLQRRDFLFGCGAALTSAIAAAVPRRAFALSDPLCVIVAASNRQTELRLPELRRVFLNQSTNDDEGHRFIPINASAGTRERVDFDQRVLGMEPDEVARFWIDQRLRGNQPPRTTSSLDTLLRVVARLPGAISYAPQSWLRPDVKALRLEGKLPGDNAYLLRR